MAELGARDGARPITIKLVTGSAWHALSGSKVFGPYLALDAQARFAKLLEQLKSAGYAEFFAASALDELNSGSRKLRARAAIKLGFKRSTEAVLALLVTAATATTELPSIVDALGRIGDARAIPLARDCVEKKLLSRRRSGAEALRNLADSEGLQRVRTLGEARLPAALLVCLKGLDETSDTVNSGNNLGAALAALEPSKRGIALDQLYEFATPLCVSVVRAALREDFSEAHLWRYAKSVLKRSMLRGDAQTFAELSLRIERKAGVTPGSFAAGKSTQRRQRALPGRPRDVRFKHRRTAPS